MEKDSVCWDFKRRNNSSSIWCGVNYWCTNNVIALEIQWCNGNVYGIRKKGAFSNNDKLVECSRIFHSKNSVHALEHVIWLENFVLPKVVTIWLSVSFFVLSIHPFQTLLHIFFATSNPLLRNSPGRSSFLLDWIKDVRNTSYFFSSPYPTELSSCELLSGIKLFFFLLRK